MNLHLRITTCAIALAAAAGAEPRYGTILLGEHHYLVAERELPYPYWSAPWTDDVTTLVVSFNPRRDIPSLLFQHYARWGEPLHEVTAVAAVTRVVGSPNADHAAGMSAVTWRDGAGAAPVLGQLFELTGAPRTPAFEVFSGLSLVSPSCGLGGGRAAFAAAADGAGGHGMFLRVFDLLGTPLQEAQMVSRSRLDEPGIVYSVMPRALDDGAVLLFYVLQSTTPATTFSLNLRRVEPDGTVAPRVVLAPFGSGYYNVSALDDGSFAYFYQTEPFGTSGTMSRVGPFGQILGSTVSVAPDYYDAAAAPDGRFALTFRPCCFSVQAQLFDATGQATSERFEFHLGPPPPDPNYPVATYENSGVVTIVWTPDDGGLAADRLSTLTPFIPGDVNDDGRINNFDIDAFVLALSDGAAYEARYHIPAEVGRILGDVNEDGLLNNFDIDPFVELLIAQP